jgi:hypothetical protein
MMSTWKVAAAALGALGPQLADADSAWSCNFDLRRFDFMAHRSRVYLFMRANYAICQDCQRYYKL